MSAQPSSGKAPSKAMNQTIETLVDGQPVDYREPANRVRQPFLDGASRKLVRSWIEREPPHEIPWVPLAKPPVAPPIVQLLKRKPWLAVKLLARDIPEPVNPRSPNGRHAGADMATPIRSRR